MKISTQKYFFKDALNSLKRNITVSTASIATVAATLFILGIFMLTLLNVNQGIVSVESQVEVKIFLKDDITAPQKTELETKVKGVAGVTAVTFESKEQALANFKEQLGDQNQSLVDGLEKDNPMPSSYIVKVNEPNTISAVVEAVKGQAYVLSIKDGREIVNKIISITNTIKWVGSAIFLILIGVSLFLIGNTIKIIVYSRRREIGIMKYIGATDWFIRWPFVIEGIILGVSGALIADGILFYAYKVVFAKVTTG
ncbi:MAG TPA: permease-like cell division protein FtsX, partial [Clostridiaceae bacterium]|nr:permease-like cell division protein FtsX [Clostridiaceae bacterium]